MIAQGQVGPAAYADGNQPGAGFRQGRLGEIIASELHGRFFEQAFRSNLYSIGGPVTALSANTITLTGITMGNLSADDFLFYLTDLKYGSAEQSWFRWNSRRGSASYDKPRTDLTCLECSSTENSRLGCGDNFPLPTRIS